MHQESRWVVFVEWSGRGALSPISRKALRAREARFRERARNLTDGVPDGCDFGTELGDFPAIIFLIIVVVLLVAIGPLIAVVAFALIEVTVVVLIAAAAIVARTLLGRPWRVLAVNARGQTWSRKQVGWGDARQLATRIQAELDAGASPEQVPPGAAAAEGPSQLPEDMDTGLVGRTWVRVASKFALLGLLVWSVAAIVTRYG
jgi:hypothetical protein